MNTIILCFILLGGFTNEKAIAEFSLKNQCIEAACENIKGTLVFNNDNTYLSIDRKSYGFQTLSYKGGILKIEDADITGYIIVTKHTLFFHVIPKNKRRYKPVLITYGIEKII